MTTEELERNVKALHDTWHRNRGVLNKPTPEPTHNQKMSLFKFLKRRLGN